MHDDAYIGGRSENNIKCVVYNDLGWKNRTTRYCRFSAASLALRVIFLSFIVVEAHSVLSRSPSIKAFLSLRIKVCAETNYCDRPCKGQTLQLLIPVVPVKSSVDDRKDIGACRQFIFAR